MHRNAPGDLYAECMGPSSLTLAALASAAAPGLEIVGSEPWSDDAEHDAALLHTADGGRLLIRVPITALAERQRAAESRALAAFTPAVRQRLPFAVAEVLGETVIGPSRAVVSTLLEGSPLQLGDLRAGSTLALSVGHSLAALHSLPVSVVVEAGLPALTPGDSLREGVAVLDRAEATGLVPASLLERWDRVLTTGELWQFQPSVIHGGLGPDVLLVQEEVVTAIVDWGDLRIADPALDLQWLLAGTAASVTETAFDAYWVARQVPVDREFRVRARFYAELELARWLLHGKDSDDDAIVADALQMLASLQQRVEGEDVPLAATTRQPLGLDEVRLMLSQQHPSIYARARPAPSDDQAG